MRKILVIFSLFIGLISHAQIHIEYISEPTDSMVLISKQDIETINKVFNERNILDSLNVVNEKLISILEINNKAQSNIITNQNLIIDNKNKVIDELELKNENSVKWYSKELRKEKNKKIAFQTTTGAGLIAVILLILL